MSSGPALFSYYKWDYKNIILLKSFARPHPPFCVGRGQRSGGAVGTVASHQEGSLHVLRQLHIVLRCECLFVSLRWLCDERYLQPMIAWIGCSPPPTPAILWGQKMDEWGDVGGEQKNIGRRYCVYS